MSHGSQVWYAGAPPGRPGESVSWSWSRAMQMAEWWVGERRNKRAGLGDGVGEKGKRKEQGWEQELKLVVFWGVRRRQSWGVCGQRGRESGAAWMGSRSATKDRIEHVLHGAQLRRPRPEQLRVVTTHTASIWHNSRRGLSMTLTRCYDVLGARDGVSTTVHLEVWLWVGASV